MKKTGRKCKDCGNTSYERDITEAFKFVWKCTECGKTHPFRKSTAKKSKEFNNIPVTTAQMKILEKLERDLKKALPESYEIKTYDVMESHSDESVYLHIMMGKVDDDGTPDEFFNRYRRDLHINERGESEYISGGTPSVINLMEGIEL